MEGWYSLSKSQANRGIARMRVGVGLPTGIPGTSSRLIIEWAHKADKGPFSSLGVIDRLVYDSYEPLTTLATAAAVTSHVKLVTAIVIGPLHADALLAKMAATIDALSGGRLVLGLAIGARKEDYDAAGIDYRTRGKRLSEQLSTLRSLWEVEMVGPQTVRPAGPALLVGGLSDHGYARVARYADGYIHGGGPPRTFALADDATLEAGRRYMKTYYAFTGPFAEKIAAGLLTNPQAIAQFLRGYEEAGCDELVLFPALPAIYQLEQLAEILISLGRSAR